MDEPIKTAIAWMKTESIFNDKTNAMYAGEIADQAAAELAAKDAELAALRQERDDWKQRAEQRAEAIQYAIEYLKETHPERVKYPEYIEFHVCNSLAIAVMPERVDGEK